MKIRMMGNPLFVETRNAMGGNGVAMGFNELFGALQTGVVDGAENNPSTLLAQNHYQVSKIKTVAMVMLLIGFSVAFGYMMALMQIPAKVTQFFLTISDNKYVFLLLVNILLLLLGTFMDLAPMLLICTPIFMPVIAKFGIDPVHFGMIMILNLGIGLITPPVGPTLFVGCAIGKVTMEQVSKELWPFYGAMCFALLLVTYIPAISLWLPGLTK